jgi:hypothetical protein
VIKLLNNGGIDIKSDAICGFNYELFRKLVKSTLKENIYGTI